MIFVIKKRMALFLVYKMFVNIICKYVNLKLTIEKITKMVIIVCFCNKDKNIFFPYYKYMYIYL